MAEDVSEQRKSVDALRVSHLSTCQTMEADNTSDEQADAAATSSPLDLSAVTVSVASVQQQAVERDNERQEQDAQSHSADPPYLPSVADTQSSTTHTADATSQPPASSASTLSSSSSSTIIISPPVKLTPGHFKPSVLLGEGSYSQVYLVHSLLDQQAYAMKVLNKAHLQRHSRTTVAYAEKAALTQCSHPNIIRLYHTFQDHSSLYFVLELCDGGDVTSLLDERNGEGGLPHYLVVYYAAQLLHCLHYLHHTAHIIHRDIKPDNMMLSSSGQLKLVDFGTAKILDTHQHSSTHLSPAQSAGGLSPKKHSFVGTAAYVAPEILTSTRPHSYAVDQWSAGATIYQLVTGRLPFQAASEYLTFQRILSGAQVEWLDGEGADGGRELVERLMERDESKRLGVQAADWEEVKRMQLFQGVDWERLDEWRVAAVRPAGGAGKKHSVMSEESLVGWRNSISSVARVGGEEKENSELRSSRTATMGEAAGTISNAEQRRGEQLHDPMLDGYRGTRLSVQREGRESESNEERKDSHSHSLPAATQHSASVGYSSSAPPSSFQSQLKTGETLTLCSAVRHVNTPSALFCCFSSSAAVLSSASHLLLTSTGRLLVINLTTGECLSQRQLSAVRSVQCEQRQGQVTGGSCDVLTIESDSWQLLDGAKGVDWSHTWRQARCGTISSVPAASTS